MGFVGARPELAGLLGGVTREGGTGMVPAAAFVPSGVAMAYI